MLVGRTSVGSANIGSKDHVNKKDTCCHKEQRLVEGQGLAGRIQVVGRKDTCWQEGHMLAERTHVGRKNKCL